ncbi:MAG: 4a-hydroxytetrahydrobiopterin dehydratase [Sphaerobacter sp.]|nr:4a-hydroxytetrahydrobiopterin dehydratase [Sphaerobacter sp.]
MARLTSADLQAALAAMPGWTLEGDALRTVVQFRTFRQAMAFINQVAELATQARHHPDMCISYNRVTLTLTTHDEGGVTARDIALARQIAELRPAEASA